jgi:hypothetical protein
LIHGERFQSSEKSPVWAGALDEGLLPSALEAAGARATLPAIEPPRAGAPVGGGDARDALTGADEPACTCILCGRRLAPAADDCPMCQTLVAFEPVFTL